ncbi:MAG: hypothetical protein IT349_11425 [Candidatus Eisenbacteria bacterium]|nr:hypothetical protein [Candidatus Eisenbacteria bacterium]MCC7142699.1 hypothetical protein [Candidatus Eisenbacteria bacterium]
MSVSSAPCPNRRRSLPLIFGQLALVGLVPVLMAGGPGVDRARAQAGVPCDAIDRALADAPNPGRMPLALRALDQSCPSLAGSIQKAIASGKWADGTALAGIDRAELLSAAVRRGHAAAETLGVSVLTAGAWADGTALELPGGARIIRSFKGELTRYRVRLLLDIYDQLEVDEVRAAIVETAPASRLPEAWLPVLDAAWNSEGDPQLAAQAALKAADQTNKDALLARLLRELPDDSTLRWARDLAAKHGGTESKKAAAARKK